MTKQYSLLFGCLLLLVMAANASESDKRGYNYSEFLEEQFGTYLKAEPQDPSLRFNQFVELNLFVLLHGPDDIEALNEKIYASEQPIPGAPNSFIGDVTLKKKIEQSKRKHAAFFAFVRKHKETYAVNSELLTELEKLEKFIAPITIQLGIYHNGQPMMANDFLASDADPADKESVRIALFEQTELSALAVALDNLPSEQAIKDLPVAVKKYRELQGKYKKFIQDYPDHKDRALHENSLAGSEQPFTTMYPEYLKDQPSKKEIEKICVREFFRKVGYGNALQERFDKAMESEDREKQRTVALEILATGKAIEAYAKKYPTLDPEYSRILHKAADQIFSTFNLTSADLE